MSQQTAPFSVTVESWGLTQQGNIRKENQDSFLNWAERKLWAVTDGVGGKEHGAAASRLVVRSLMQTPAPVSLDAHMDAASGFIREANRLLLEQAGGASASTVVALLMHGGMAACLWAGDSRCYLMRGGVLYQCTKDHTLRQQKIDAGELTAPEAVRMIKGNIITNAVGVRDDMDIGEVRFSLKPCDRFLLCSDGLSNLLAPESLSGFLAKDSAREAAHGISDTLKSMTQPDNITFILVFVSNVK